MLLTDIIKNQETIRKARAGSDYTKFNGKKPLAESARVAEVHLAAISMLKNTFEFNLHKDNRYLVVTIFDRPTKKYSYAVLDLASEDLLKSDIPVFDFIKEAKQYVSGLLGEVSEEVVPATEEVTAEEVTEEEVTEEEVTQDEPVESAPAADTVQKVSRARAARK